MAPLVAKPLTPDSWPLTPNCPLTSCRRVRGVTSKTDCRRLLAFGRLIDVHLPNIGARRQSALARASCIVLYLAPRQIQIVALRSYAKEGGDDNLSLPQILRPLRLTTNDYRLLTPDP